MTALPYVTSPGNIDKALNGIKSASVPDMVSQDFVKTILKIPGGSGNQMTTFLKKLGLSNTDGSPNEIYKKFRNPSSSGAAIAKSIRHAYAPLYVRSEFMHLLNNSELLGLVVEETGQPHDSNPVKLIVRCIEHLKPFADFEATLQSTETKLLPDAPEITPEKWGPSSNGHSENKVGLNLGYTINLNLPATSDPDVFDAIFKSLKDNLLREDNG